MYASGIGSFQTTSSGGVFSDLISGLASDNMTVSSGGNLTITSSGTTTIVQAPIISGLSASSAVATNASKQLVSVANTGTGNNVLQTSPTLITPILGTPTSGTLTNCTGYPASSLTGTTLASNVVASSLTSVGTLTSLAVVASGFTIDSSGRMKNAKQPCFHVRLTADQLSVTGDGTVYTVAFNNVIADQTSSFSNPSFTAPVTGFYQFNITLYLYGIASQNDVELYLNTTTLTYSLTRQNSSTKNGNNQLIICASQMVPMNSGNTANVSILVGGGTPVKTTSLSSAGTYFSGFLVC